MSRKVLVLGLGKSGIAVARHILSDLRLAGACGEHGSGCEQGGCGAQSQQGSNANQGTRAKQGQQSANASQDELVIYAGKSSNKVCEAAKEFIDAGIKVVFDEENVEGHFNLCIVSPGIPQTSKFYKSALAASDELISEPEFAFCLSPQEWIAVTGTNGKTTSTSCISHVFNECAMPAYACGNIGKTATEAVENRRENEVLVAEMSSYQLASITSFAPRTACLLNITPDHLSWHGSFEAYSQAKLNIFQNLRAGQSAVICDGIKGTKEIENSLLARGVRVIKVGAQKGKNCAYEKDGILYVELEHKKYQLCATSDLQIKGKHNVINALVAAAVAIDYGLDAASVGKALCSFKPLSHRIEPVANIDGVEFFNDSKATNVDASLQALTAFPNQGIYILLGGTDKKTPLDALVSACETTCKCAICYGQAGKRFYDAFENSTLPRVLCKNMREAFEYAYSSAKSGDVVLLSPACASFDEFDSFIHRGNVFKEWVFEKERKAK